MSSYYTYYYIGALCYNIACLEVLLKVFYRSDKMSAAEIKEIISFAGIGLLILVIAFIQISRRKLTGVLSVLVSILAYICLIIGGLIVVYIVISGPTG